MTEEERQEEIGRAAMIKTAADELRGKDITTEGIYAHVPEGISYLKSEEAEWGPKCAFEGNTFVIRSINDEGIALCESKPGELLEIPVTEIADARAMHDHCMNRQREKVMETIMEFAQNLDPEVMKDAGGVMLVTGTSDGDVKTVPLNKKRDPHNPPIWSGNPSKDE